MTQEDLASGAGITVSALSRIERALNNPGWMTVMRITRALNVGLVQLATELEAAATEAAHGPSDQTPNENTGFVPATDIRRK